MEFNHKIFNKITGPLSVEAKLSVSLFVVSNKDSRLKKLSLEGLSPEERITKLQKWAEQNRFVAVVALGDQIFAHVSGHHAEKLKDKDLSIGGKKVTVKALTDEQTEELSAIGKAFEEYLLEETGEEKEKENHDRRLSRPEIQQFFANKRLISDKMPMDYLIAMMKNVPGQVILKCLQELNEARREAEEEKRADEKRADIKEQVIRKEIIKKEVGAQELKAKTLKQDAEQVNKTRGA